MHPRSQFFKPSTQITEKKFTLCHSGSTSLEIDKIPSNCNFYRCGSGHTIVNSVASNVHITVKGKSSLTITGNISSGCTLCKEGDGHLVVEGSVEHDIKIRVSGRGKVIFTQPLEDSTINSIHYRYATAEVISGNRKLAFRVNVKQKPNRASAPILAP